MAEVSEIKATVRDGFGKSASRAARREGRIPGVIYGDNTDPEPVTLDSKEFWQHARSPQFLNTIYMLDVDGKQQRVIPRDVQLDPVRDVPLHVDFLRLGKGAKVTVEVPVQFLNEEESPGLKRGGVLNIVRHAIELRCVAESIPEQLEADLTGLDIGDSMHVSSIKFPEGVELTISDRDFTVATIVGRMAEIVEEDEMEGEEGEGLEGEAAEGEAEEGEAEGGEQTDGNED